MSSTPGDRRARDELTEAYRRLGLIIAGAVMIFGVLRHMRAGEFIDPLELRAAIVAAFLSAVAASYRFRVIREHIGSIITVLSFVLSGWTIWLGWANHLEPSLATTINLLSLVVALLLGILGQPPRVVGAFIGFNSILCIASVLTIDAPRMNPRVFLAGFVGSSIASMVVILLHGRTRRRQEEAEAQWRALVSSHPDAIFLARDGVVSFANTRAERLFREEIVGRPVRDLGAFEGVGDDKPIVEIQGHSLAITRSEVILDGTRAEQYSLHDLTDRVERERLLEAAKAEAELASRAKAEFLAVVSHEIRTPLNGILGLADVLYEQQLDPNQRELVELIRASGDSLSMIINDILDFSKIEAGRMELEQMPFSLRELAVLTERVMQPRAKERGVALSIRFQGTGSVAVGDPLRVRQILFNLVSNAIKFTKDGEVGASIYRDGDKICIRVRDTGVGIPAARLDRLFEPFTQAEAGTTRKFGGTGLGLSICRQLASMMNGKIWVESELGKGSCFAVDLELVRAPEGALPPAHDTTSIEGIDKRLSILVAEDNLVNQKVVGALLERLGLSATMASDGAEAVRLCESSQFDIILMDMMMPVMDGLEAARSVRGSQSCGQPYIIALTANASEEDRRRCRDAGMNDFVTKPLRREALVAAFDRFALSRFTASNEGREPSYVSEPAI